LFVVIGRCRFGYTIGISKGIVSDW